MSGCGSDKVKIAEERNETLYCSGYKRSLPRTVLVYILGFLTAGFFLLVIYYWRPDWGLKLTHYRSPFSEADAVLLQDAFSRYHVSRIFREKVGEVISKEVLLEVMNRDVIMGDSFLYFRFQKVKYIWDPKEETFFKLRGLDRYTTADDLYRRAHLGLDSKERSERQSVYGINKIKINVKSIPLLLIQEVLNPFYIFQIFSVTVWIVDEYLYYSFCIIALSVLSISVSLYTTRTQATTLRAMVRSNTTVQVLRPNGEVETVWEDQLVPGDVLIIPSSGCTMTCDAVLVAGNCIVNESSLTGESVPITKTPLPNPESGELTYSMDEHKRHTLFCGTHVIQTRFYAEEKVKAVVVLTGFSTAKGNMVRSILYPMPTEIKLFRDSLLFVAILAGFAFIGFAYTVVVLALDETAVKEIVLKSLDIITIAVPPALPAALTIGMVYAQLRLKRRGIFCISPQRINLCGALDILCFDKTGTLTEDGLDLLGVQETSEGGFGPMIADPKSIPIGPFVSTMATCHSLTFINGELAGDPLDIKMFEATGWILEDSNPAETSNYDAMVPTVVRSPGKHADLKAEGDTGEEDAGEIGIIKQFPFSSSLQRMSVIARAMNAKHMTVHCKGAPEKIASLCLPDTIPNNFEDTLRSYTADGFRVLALAWKPMDPSLQWHKAQKIQRDSVEKDLQFLGLLILQNKLKPETIPAIRELHDANLRTVMITGDNILTAVNVARKCGIIRPGGRAMLVEATTPLNGDKLDVQYSVMEYHDTKEELSTKGDLGVGEIIVDMENRNGTAYAMDGKTFGVIREYDPELMNKLSVHASVFARMSPDQKMQLIEIFQKLEYHVGMCGDGANDCGALKLAHAGVALSEAEASVAAPFTSKIHDISCIPTVMKEGRASLTTSFGMFKFMALYSMIQFTSAMILLWDSGYLGDLQFLYIDIILSTVVVLLMGRNEAYPILASVPPPPQLMEVTIIFSMVANVFVQCVLQGGIYALTQQQVWYHPPERDEDGITVTSYEGTAVFVLSCFLYLNSAVAFSPGKPYRQELYTNWLFLLSLIIMYTMTVLILFHPPQWLRDLMEIEDIPDYAYKGIILSFAMAHIAMAFIIELVLVPWKGLMRIVSCRHCRKTSLTSFQQLQMDDMRSL
ncbi:polyamine-transporting ATPase 13A3-like [Diadema antillarum]|uniref:polyamine-transporting ATPase 13A3-like n=1 Tax=Diadema antillarum TaxID=105358 RepID=UPI003A8A27D9